MSVITKVEAKSPGAIFFRVLVFTLLVVGGATMVYPFLLMLAGSLRSEMDSADMGMAPRYLSNVDDLTRKFLETKYNHRVRYMNQVRGYKDYSFLQATIPREVNQKEVEAFRRFMKEENLPDHWMFLGGTYLYRRIVPENLRLFQKRLKKAYGGDLEALNVDLGIGLKRWRNINMQMPDWTNPRFSMEKNLYYQTLLDLTRERPLAERGFSSVSGQFVQTILAPKYDLDTPVEYNQAHTKKIRGFHDYSLPRRMPGPDEPTLQAEWEFYIRESLNSSFIRTDQPVSRYQDFLKEKYQDIQTLNDRWGTDFSNFDAIAFPGDRQWVPSGQRVDYEEFLAVLPPETLYLVGPEYAWQDWLKAQYGSVEKYGQAIGKSVRSWREVRLPVAQIEKDYVQKNTGALRWKYATLNFRNVFDEILFQGRSLFNTSVYVILSLLLSLTIMPLAAYSLSRFSPPGTWRFILIYMATMAFPPMVGMIPQFLILRKLHLLNTFIALVLPVVVNGYFLFLLKGFFDSLPQHLYEAALIDGASELRMFLEITMALSKPILAVLALQVFQAAWISFMYPLLVCPEESMHVLAVWLHQFQTEAGKPAVYASILVTSIPTLLIFLFTQRTIMRGIAVPAEK